MLCPLRLLAFVRLSHAFQQGYLDSLSLLAEALLCWRPSQQGLFLGLLCAAMVPVNLAVGAASAHASDRSLVLGSLAACCAALAALAAGAAASAALFLGGGAGLLAASVALEGCATSLMSKVIWRGFATGVFNAGVLSCRCHASFRPGMGCQGFAVPGLCATVLPVERSDLQCALQSSRYQPPNQPVHPLFLAGLLSTEAGTLGRFAGNGLLWGAARATGPAQEQLPRFALLLYGTLGALCCALLACLACTYRRLKG